MEPRQLTVDDMMERRRWWWRWSGGGMWGRGGLQTGASALSHILRETLLLSPDVCGVCAYQFRDRKKKNLFKANDCYEMGRGEPLIPSPLLTQLSLMRRGFMNMVIWTFLLPAHGVIKMLSDAQRHWLPRLSPAWQEGSNLNLFPMPKSLLKPQKRHLFPWRSNTHGDRAT